MKRILFIFALPLALCAAHGASAQSKSETSAPKADTMMISEMTEGDYFVRRYVVCGDADAGYAVYYKISTSQLVPAFDNNSQTLVGLGDFISSIDSDSLMHVKSVMISGYASPDGPRSLNEKLAKERVQSLKSYADQRFGLSEKYDVKMQSEALTWDNAREAIVASDVPEKQMVLSIMDQRDADPAKEKRLKTMPAVWNYLVANVLPSMRYTELAIVYCRERVVEQRTLIPQPVVEPGCEPQYDPCACVDVYEAVSGIIVEMDDVDVDFEKR